MIDMGGIKRLLDLAFAITLLIVFSIPLMLVAIALKMEANGSVIFRQERAGLKGEVFTLYKLRSIRIFQAGNGFSQKEYEVTPVGRFIRKWRIDELPQLFNVLKGEMSIVGPRPTLRYQLERYSPEQWRRLDVKPGLTGWAQIHGDSAISWPERITMDLWYIDHWSVWLDIVIMVKTPFALFRIKDINTASKLPPDEISERSAGKDTM